MYTNFPYIYEAQILKVDTAADNVNVPLYTCLVNLRDGRRITVSNARMTTMFGEIGNYLALRSQAHFDDSKSQKEVLSQEQAKQDAAIGARVFIQFVGGHITNPIITGFDTHPNQILDITDPADKDPQLAFQYNGVRVVIKDNGDLAVVHKGKPEVKFSPKSITDISVPDLTGNPDLGASNPALTPAPKEEVTLFEMTSGGIFRVRDAEGQMLEFDRSKPTINITNNGIKSTDATDGIGALLGFLLDPDADFLLLDKSKKSAVLSSRKLTEIKSGNARKDTTKGDHSHIVTGNTSWKVGGDEDEKIAGSSTKVVAGDVSLKSVGKLEHKDATGAGMTVNKGKVAFGSKIGNVEVLDTISKILEQFITNAPAIVNTVVGPGQLSPAVVAQFVIMKALIDAVKGSL